MAALVTLELAVRLVFRVLKVSSLGLQGFGLRTCVVRLFEDSLCEVILPTGQAALLMPCRPWKQTLCSVRGLKRPEQIDSGRNAYGENGQCCRMRRPGDCECLNWG